MSILQQINFNSWVALLASLLLSGCDRSPVGKIERVLDQCAEISAKASRMGDHAGQAKFVAEAIQKIDSSRCPADFRIAFQEHVNAWHHAQGAYAANTVGANVLEGVIAGVTENPYMLGQTASAAGHATQYINATLLSAHPDRSRSRRPTSAFR